MKKTLLVLAALLLTAAASGQGRPLPSTRFGFKLGASVVSYNIEGKVFGFEERLSRPAAAWFGAISGYYGMRSLPMFVRGEIIYEVSKFKKEYTWGTSTLTAASVSFPVMIGWSFEMSRDLGLQLYAGPAFNLMSQATLDGEESLSAGELFRKPTVSAAAGVGLTWWKLTLEARYNLYPARREVELYTDKYYGDATLGTWGGWSFSIGILF